MVAQASRLCIHSFCWSTGGTPAPPIVGEATVEKSKSTCDEICASQKRSYTFIIGLARLTS
jgi:hypothetical protein